MEDPKEIILRDPFLRDAISRAAVLEGVAAFYEKDQPKLANAMRSGASVIRGLVERCAQAQSAAEFHRMTIMASLGGFQ